LSGVSTRALSLGGSFSPKGTPLRADPTDHLSDARRKPAGGLFAPLGAVAPPISPSQSTARPEPSLRATRRFQEWKTEIGRQLAAQSAKGADEAALGQRAYEAKLAAGPDWLRYRADSAVMDAPPVRISRQDRDSILAALDTITRRGLRWSGGIEREVLTALKGGAIRRTIASMIRVAMKWGRVYPSLVGLASKSLAACATQTAHNAIKALVALGFVTKHRRVKEIETPYGRKLVQDNNAYEIHMPPAGSLGDRILRGDLSESKIERAKAKPCFYSDSSLSKAPKQAVAQPKIAPKPVDRPVPEAERSLVKTKLHALLASLRPQPAT
jgi:hypothetical protein